MTKLMVYSPVLKLLAPVTALQDPSTVTAGKRYYNGHDVRLRPLGYADGRPYQGHKGIDFGVPQMTVVYALYDGWLWASTEHNAGHCLKLTTHSSKLEVNHRHLHSYIKRTGRVKAGEAIAYTGNTGFMTTGAHLHVDIITDGGKRVYDCYPYVMGVYTEWGNPISGNKTSKKQDIWTETDQWEYELDTPIFYAVDTDGMPLNIRKSPGTHTAIIGSLKNGTHFTIDKRADLPNKQLWGRLQDSPWNWVCLYDGKQWLVRAANAKPANQWYRVRKSWSDAKSQIGAFKSLDNAKRAVKPGYRIYDDRGKEMG